MQDAFRHIYQRFILESDETVLKLVYKVGIERFTDTGKSEKIYFPIIKVIIKLFLPINFFEKTRS